MEYPGRASIIPDKSALEERKVNPVSRKYQKTGIDTPPKGNDFKLINGIKQGIEKRLHEADIRTYTQLACLTPQEILSIIGKGRGYSIKRIEEENWIGQAQALIPNINRYIPDKRKTATPTIRQHYENFTIELLLDEKNLTRRTHIVHVQSGDADTWAGWESEQMLNFVLRHTGIHPPLTKPARVKSLKRNVAAPKSNLVEEISSSNVQVISEIPRVQVTNKHAPSVPSLSDSQPKTIPMSLTEASPIQPDSLRLSSKGENTGSVMLLDWKITLPNNDQPMHNISQEQAFDVTLTLDIDHASLPKESSLECNAKLYAKKLGNKTWHPIGEIQKSLPFDDILPLTIQGINLSKGIYRLEARVTIQPVGLKVGSRQKIMSFLESGLIQIY